MLCYTPAVEAMADIFGYAGMVTGVSFMIPQVYKTYQTKSVEDLSWGMMTLLSLNCVLWFSYGLILDSLPLMLTNGTALAVNLALITLKVRYRNNP